MRIDAKMAYFIRQEERRRPARQARKFNRLRKQIAVNYLKPIVDNPNYAHRYNSIMIKQVRRKGLMIIGVKLD